MLPSDCRESLPARRTLPGAVGQSSISWPSELYAKQTSDSLPCAVSYTDEKVTTPYTPCPLWLPGSRHWSKHVYGGLSCYRLPPSCMGFISLRNWQAQLVCSSPSTHLRNCYPLLSTLPFNLWWRKNTLSPPSLQTCPTRNIPTPKESIHMAALSCF